MSSCSLDWASSNPRVVELRSTSCILSAVCSTCRRVGPGVPWTAWAWCWSKLWRGGVVVASFCRVGSGAQASAQRAPTCVIICLAWLACVCIEAQSVFWLLSSQRLRALPSRLQPSKLARGPGPRPARSIGQMRFRLRYCEEVFEVARFPMGAGSLVLRLLLHHQRFPIWGMLCVFIHEMSTAEAQALGACSHAVPGHPAGRSHQDA